MDHVDLEAIVPGLAEARARERIARSIAFCKVNLSVCGCECVPLTPRHRLELEVVGNGFFADPIPSKSDVFQFLWRLSPGFVRKIRTPAAWLRRRRIARIVRKTPILSCAMEVNDFLKLMLQDLPANATVADGVPGNLHYVHWIASEIHFYASNGILTATEYMDTPYLELQQLHRAHQAATQENPEFINESDRLVLRWQADMTRKARNVQN